jgi:uncharacterized protein DUF4154
VRSPQGKALGSGLSTANSANVDRESAMKRVTASAPLKVPRRHRLRLRLTCLGAAWALIVAPAMKAEREKPTDYQVKAAYLYNFGKFISWPPKPDSSTPAKSFNLCVLGKDPFGPLLDSTVADESIEGKTVVVSRIARAQDAAPCAIVFVSHSEAERLKTVLDALRSSNALTVSDIPGFADQGGMIGFVISENRVRFEVNLVAAQHAGLALSSELLKVALSVKQGGH